MNNYFFIKSKFTILLLVLLFSVSSCVTNKDLEYFRTSKDVSKVKLNTNEYRLQVGDLISVQISTVTEQQHDFFNKEQTSNSQLMMQNPYLYGYLVKEGGFLDLPSLGKVKAEGFTLRELENIIKQIAVSYFEQPIVKLNIINFEVSVLGAVNNPGNYKIVNPEANVLYALSLANDMTEYGNRKRVKVIRNNKEENRIFYVDLTDMKTLNNPNFMLQPQDIIYVAPLNKRFYAFTNLPNLISMSISAITLYLLINKN
jgi:polysaccharide export outer membrane protein|tara:strand:- start:1312 stop:2082 length:771 start_codon:yes stop_codon:yes gene_type:complete